MKAKTLGYILVVPHNTTIMVVPRLSIKAKRTICEIASFVLLAAGAIFAAAGTNGAIPLAKGLACFVVLALAAIGVMRKGGMLK